MVTAPNFNLGNFCLSKLWRRVLPGGVRQAMGRSSRRRVVRPVERRIDACEARVLLAGSADRKSVV